MKSLRFFVALALALCLAAGAQAQPKKKKVLAVGQSKGYEHDAVSHGMATIWKLGQQTGLWDTYIRTDTELLTKKKLDRNAKNLDYFDAVFFYTSGELDMDDQQKADLSITGVHRTDKDFAITWIRNYGKGRVFYSGLGHREEVWDRPDVQQMWIEGVKWSLGLISADATPRPKSAN